MQGKLAGAAAPDCGPGDTETARHKAKVVEWRRRRRQQDGGPRPDGEA